MQTTSETIVKLVLTEIESRIGYKLEEIGCQSFDEIVALVEAVTRG